MFYNFIEGCIGFMVNDFWTRYLRSVGKEIIASVILAVIFGLLIGMVALVAWPIAGGAVALGMLLSPVAIEIMLCALVPLMVGVLMVAVYCAFWVGTAAVMLTGVIVMGAAMGAYELGCAVGRLGSFIFGSKTPAVAREEVVLVDLRRPIHFASSSTRGSDGQSSESRLAFFVPAGQGESAARARVAPIDYPPAFPEYESPAKGRKLE